MQKDKLEKLKKIKKDLQKEGFIIDGIVGSFVKSDIYNDIDIVYHLESEFLEKYQGFSAINRLEEIRNLLRNLLDSEIDLIDRDYTNKIMKNVISRDMTNV